MHVTEDQLKAITEIAAKEAIKAHQQEREQYHQKQHDRRLRNIKLLLRNYRSFKKHCEDVKIEIDEINERIGLVTVDSEEFKLESIKRSKEKTLIMVKYTEKMMQVYKVLCEESDDESDVNLYKTVYDLYISEDRKTVEQVAEWQKVAKRTVYRNIERACESLTVLMFGIDGVKF